MRQQRSAAERPARAPPPTKTHPAKSGQHTEEKAQAVWERFKGQPHPEPAQPGKEAVMSVAEAIVLAGASAATAAAIIRAEPAILRAPPASVAAKMHALAPLTTGALTMTHVGRGCLRDPNPLRQLVWGSALQDISPRYLRLSNPLNSALPMLPPHADAVKTRQAQYRKLGPAAARAAVLGLSDAKLEGSIQLLSELVGSARLTSRHPQHDKAWEVLQGCDDAHLSALLCDHSVPQLHQLREALQQHLGWEGPQAAAALLRFAGTAQAPSACPHSRFRQLTAASPEGVFALSVLLR